MKKNYLKISLLPLSIGLLIFILFLLSEWFSSIANLEILPKSILFLIISLILGLVISNGFSAFIPSFKDSVLALRQMYRFESLSHPLLLRLAYEAPGTYHHSINVSILSQQAAKSIGADALLVRLGAYYHDIGKLENPEQYIENQSGAEIPQSEDAHSIRSLAQKIIHHVQKGIEIAEINHLPNEITNLITEHHGTTHMLYFFEKAKEKGLRIRKTDFRYHGPIPQTKEAIILMFADSCEAAARAVNNLSDEKIVTIVNNAVDDKITEGQLKTVGLSDSEILKIKESLIKTLKSIYHQRVLNKNESN